MLPYFLNKNMKKHRQYILATALLLFTCLDMSAQVNKEQTITVTNNNGKEEQIDLPEAMNQDLDSAKSLYSSKAYLQPDTNCNLPDVNPMYAAEVYKQRLSKLPTIIEMPYNDIVQKFIDRYSGELRHSVAYMLGAQNFYIPIFEEALESYDLPLELKYLPVIESGLNPNAVSHAGAAGLWQFMISTAKRYDLTVNSLVDERRDLYKASYAAAHYLSDLYKQFGDWNLVIAAYNCGADKINKAIRRSKGERDYWKIYPRLPRETRGYVPAFIAANYIMNYYCEHNICPMKSTLPEKADTVMVSNDINLAQVAAVLGMDIDQLRELNPQYRRDIVNGGSGLCALRLPAKFINAFIDKEEDILAYKPEEYLTKRTEVTASGGRYTVNRNKVTLVDTNSTPKAQTSTDNSTSDQDDETNQSISRKSRSKTSSRRQTKSRSKKSSNNKKSRKKQTSKSVTVKDGDTLSEIAERNHTTVKKLRKLNGISGSTIQKGKKIKVK